ncbi:hypothetical protein BJV78DRAFT_4463 [Lactifluus subvellereus]|nr:hypothetical protein BJV78DRAFT_4463 [Lactifluus subvellereus]
MASSGMTSWEALTNLLALRRPEWLYHFDITPNRSRSSGWQEDGYSLVVLAYNLRKLCSGKCVETKAWFRFLRTGMGASYSPAGHWHASSLKVQLASQHRLLSQPYRISRHSSMRIFEQTCYPDGVCQSFISSYSQDPSRQDFDRLLRRVCYPYSDRRICGEHSICRDDPLE